MDQKCNLAFGFFGVQINLVFIHEIKLLNFTFKQRKSIYLHLQDERDLNIFCNAKFTETIEFKMLACVERLASEMDAGKKTTHSFRNLPYITPLSNHQTHGQAWHACIYIYIYKYKWKTLVFIFHSYGKVEIFFYLMTMTVPSQEKENQKQRAVHVEAAANWFGGSIFFSKKDCRCLKMDYILRSNYSDEFIQKNNYFPNIYFFKLSINWKWKIRRSLNFYLLEKKQIIYNFETNTNRCL